MPRSRTAAALSFCSLLAACATGESSTPDTDSMSFAGSSGASTQGGSGGLPAAGTAGSSTPVTTGGAFSTAGTSPETAGAAGSAGAGIAGASGITTGGQGGAGGTGSSGTATGGDGTSGSGTAGTSTMPTVCPDPQGAAQALPLTVSGNFIPSGYFAGPSVNTAGIVQAACEARPAGHSIGECYKFTFQATMLEAGGAYGGVFWQHGANNWGTEPGLKVAPGATKVTFKAWSANGGELVEFSAGGIGDGATLCADGVNLGQGNGTKVTLTKTPTQYTISLQGQSYAKGIIGGFVWSAAVNSTDQILSFYVDEIQWVQ